MAYTVRVANSAAKAIGKLPRSTQKRVVRAIESLSEDPRPDGCRKLSGSDSTYRVRVGDHRVIYDVDNDDLLVLVVRVRHRRDAYRKP